MHPTDLIGHSFPNLTTRRCTGAAVFAAQDAMRDAGPWIGRVWGQPLELVATIWCTVM